MKIKNLILVLFLLINAFVFSQSASNNAKISDNALMLKTIKAYQIKSENKIEEFYNLLNVVGNPTISLALKKQTILEIVKLFKDKNIKIPNFFENPNKEILLNDFLILIAKSKEIIFFQVENKSQSYVQETNGGKFWTIGFDLTITIDKSKNKIKNVMQNVSLLQEEKQFGTNKKLVWNTYLTLIWLK